MAILAALFAQGIGGSAPILMMVAIFAIFYVLLIMPQQRRQKKWQAMLQEIKPGDKVVTSGGLRRRHHVGKGRCGRPAGPSGQHQDRSYPFLDRHLDDRGGRAQVLRVAVSHEQESPSQNSSDYCGADRLSLRHLRHSQSFSGEGLLAAMQKRIHLGLDLKGGTHLILQVQVNDASQRRHRPRGRAPEGRPEDAPTSPYGEISKPDPQNHPELIQIKGVPPESASELRRIVSERLPTTI